MTSLLALSLLLAQADAPAVPLANDQVRLTVYPPDPAKGFYRGTRFSWAGVFGNVKYAGHTLFHPWKDKHDPANNDDIVGPVEEFGMDAPVGYADAKVGEPFLKIGVGALTKVKEEKYLFWGKYKIADHGKWATTATKSSVTSTHEAAARGYGYKLATTIAVDAKEPVFTIRGELTNTGTRPFATDFYNHNFFNVDRSQVGSDYAIAFPFPATAKTPKERFTELVKLDAGKLTLAGPLATGSVWAELGGNDPAAPYAFVLTHAPSKVSLTVASDRPAAFVRVWGMATTLCPEPFVAIPELAPGKSYTWQTRYALAKGK